MADYVEIIGQLELDKLDSVPAKLLAILNGIGDINKTPLNFKGLNESLDALSKFQAQSQEIYAQVTTAQKRATAAVLDLAKAEKQRADANLANVKADAIKLKATQDQATADNDSIAIINKKSDAEQAANDKRIAQAAKLIDAVNADAANQEIADQKKIESDEAATEKQLASAAKLIDSINIQAEKEDDLAAAKRSSAASIIDSINKEAAAHEAMTQKELEDDLRLLASIKAKEASGQNLTQQELQRRAPEDVPLTIVNSNQPTASEINAGTGSVEDIEDAAKANAAYAASSYGAKAATDAEVESIQKLPPALSDVNDGSGKVASGLDLVDKVGNRLVYTFTRFIATTLIFTGLIDIVKALYGAFNDYYDATHAAETEQTMFNKALQDTQKTASSDLAVLEQLQASLNDNTVSRKDLAAEINNAAAKYPEYMGYLATESALTGQINSDIEKQIDLINQRAISQASLKVLADAQDKVNDAQDKYNSILNGSIGFWQRAGLGVVAFSNANLSAGETETLLKGASESLMQAIDLKNVALQRATNNTQYQIDVNKKAIQSNIDQIDGNNKLIETYKAQGALNQVQLLQNENSARQDIIKTISAQNEALGLQNIIRQQSVTNQLSQTQILALNSDTQLKNDIANGKKGTQQYLDDLKTRNDAQLKQQEESLANKYKAQDASYETSASYLAELANLRATARQSEGTAQVSFNKKSLTQQKQAESEAQKARDAHIAANKELTDAEREGQNLDLEKNIQNQKQIYEDTSKSLTDRLSAYAEYYADKNEQAINDANAQTQILHNAQEQIAQIEAIPEAKRTESDKKLVLTKEAVAQELLNVDKKLAAAQATNAAESVRQIFSIHQSADEKNQSLLDAQLENLKEAGQASLNSEIQAETELYEKKKETYKKYSDDIKDILIKNAEDTGNAEIAQIERTLATEELTTDQRKTDADKIVKIRADTIKIIEGLNNGSLESQIENDKKLIASGSLVATEGVKTEDNLNKKKKQLDKEYIDGSFQIAKAALTSLQTLYDASSQRKIQNYEDENTALANNLQSQIDAINASGEADTQKQTDIQKAQAITAAQQAAITEEENKQKQKQAAFDKAITISNIILKTSEAVIAALTAGIPGVPFAAAAALTGAIELATAIATPIPQYAKGTKNHPGGWMEVGDGGQMEYIEEPGKPGQWSPDTSTLMYGAPGTKVTPASDIKDILMRDIYSGASSLNSGSLAGFEINAISNKELLNETKKLNSNFSQLSSDIKNKKELHVTIDQNGFNVSQTHGISRMEYLNKNLDF